MGVLSAYATRLSIAQRTLYDRLRSSGVPDDVARQLAVAIEKNVSPAHSLAKSIVQRVQKGTYHQEFANEAKGWLPAAVVERVHQKAKARSGGKASGQARRDKKEREAAQPAEPDTMPPLPIEKKQKALGAAFAHAKASGKDQSPKARRRRANQWLKENGHTAIGKSLQGTFSLSTKIFKAEEKPWQRLVYSVVYSPDTEDLHGDRMDAATIEKAAHEAMRAGIYINSEHRGPALGAHVVESYIAPCNMSIDNGQGRTANIQKGTWVMGMKITDDAVWAKVLDGTYDGFSLEGTGTAIAFAA